MNIAIPFAAVVGAVVPSAGFNNNFTEVANKFNTYAVQTDVAKVISAAHTFSVQQTIAGLNMTGDLLFTDATYDIGKSAATRPRDGFFSRNMVVGGTLTLNSGVINMSSFVGTSTMLGGSAGHSLRNAANNADNFAVTDAGVATIRAGLTVTAGGLTVSAGGSSFLAGVVVAGGMSINSGGLAVVGDLLFTDALYDIGKTGATRPRDGFFSRDLTVGRFLTVTSSATVNNLVTGQNGATNASLNMPHSSGPPSITVTNGDVWTTTAGLFVKINGSNQQVLFRNTQTGYTAMTGTIDRSTSFATSTVTLAQLAGRVMAIQADLTTFPIIGP